MRQVVALVLLLRFIRADMRNDWRYPGLEGRSTGWLVSGQGKIRCDRTPRVKMHLPNAQSTLEGRGHSDSSGLQGLGQGWVANLHSRLTGVTRGQWRVWEDRGT